MGWRYVSHVLPESKSVAILVVNECPPFTPISVCFNKVGLLKANFFSEGMFLYRGFSLLQSEQSTFLHFTGLFLKIFFVFVEAF